MIRRTVLLTAVQAALACIPLLLPAAEPRLKAEVVTKPPILVGQRVTIRIVLFTETIFSDAPAFEIPSIPGAVLMHVEDRPLLGTEDVDGTSYTTQTHELAFFAMRPGRFTIPAFDVRFESPPMFGQKPVAVRVKTPRLAVVAGLPKGAEGLQTLICTSELSVVETWSPRPGKSARVGDGFTRKVTVTAPGVVAMALPPLPFAGTSILGSYPQPAGVSDRTERGAFAGTRVERVTYVCERPGETTLPALVIPWWNLAEGKLMKVTLPAVSLTIEAAAAAPPDDASSSPSAPRSFSWRFLASISAAAGIALWMARGRLGDAWRGRRSDRAMGESGRFHVLLGACERSDAVAAYNALLRWLDARDERSILSTIETNLSCITSDRQVHEDIADLEQAVIRQAAWSGAPLAMSLKRLPRSGKKGSSTADSLPLLNPLD